MFSQILRGAELYETHRNARALGMGNAFVSLVDGDEALFFNPAGLARNGGFFWKIMDPAGGANQLDTTLIENAQGLTSDVPAEFEAALDSLYGEPVWGGINAKTSLITPFVSVAYYWDTDISVQVQNPVAPEIEANVVSDIGVALGTGFGLGLMDFGAVLKRIERTGGRTVFGASDIASIINGGANTFSDVIEAQGLGYAFDIGMNFYLPTLFQPTLSFVWKNIGDTSFRAANVGDPRPPTDEQEMIVGGSIMFDAGVAHIVPSFDFKHLDNHNAQIGKRIHLGLEVGLPLLDLRAGYHQGYLSYGAGFNLGFMRIDAASWGVELGEYPGQIEDRRYMVQFTMELGFDFGLSSSASNGGGSSSSDSAFGSSSSSSSSNGSSNSNSNSRSRWSRRNKARR